SSSDTVRWRAARASSNDRLSIGASVVSVTGLLVLLRAVQRPGDSRCDDDDTEPEAYDGGEGGQAQDDEDFRDLAHPRRTSSTVAGSSPFATRMRSFVPAAASAGSRTMASSVSRRTIA